MEKLTGDFETTVDVNDVRVWAWAVCDIDTIEVIGQGIDIESFFEYVSNKNTTIYFHNLKFDGEFIIHWLLSNGFTHSDTKEPNTFETLITDDGVFYSLTVYFKCYNKRYLKCTIYDSLKKLPFKVAQIADAFKLETKKGEIDYKKHREKGYQPDAEEWDYIYNDVKIVAQALRFQFAEGLTKMTVGSDALHGFKTIIGKDNFKKWFPVLPFEVDEDIRKAYRGGWTYLNPRYKNKRTHGMVFDINSLYPSVMYDKPLPYGCPEFYTGCYPNEENYPLYIQRLWCEFKVKPKHLPMIQIKRGGRFVPTEYLTSSEGEIVCLTLTSVDLELFFKHYDVQNLEYECGWMFKSCEGVFKEYIDYWMRIKETSTGARRALAKLMLNSLYGKFATNPVKGRKSPYLKDGIVKYHEEEPEIKEPVFTPMGVFITAWARYKEINAAQDNYAVFMYGDTDSIHLNILEVPSSLDVHPTRLGAFKHEATFQDCKYLRAKTYMETIDGEVHVTCAGMPENVKKLVTYENFKIGSTFGGKLRPKHCVGGIVLEDSDFTIQH